MSRASAAARFETIRDLLRNLGGISPGRVRLKPTPGKATERDLIRLNDTTDRLYELVDGTLVEKVMGYPESTLALHIGSLIKDFLRVHDLGLLAGADGGMRLMPGLVRMPDLSFVSWDRLPQRGVIPMEPIAGLAPDLAVEVLSKGNPRGEVKRKVREYFLSGVSLVWLVNMRKRTVTVHTAPDVSVTLTEEGTLDGGAALPGLALPVREIFLQVPRGPVGGRRAGRNRRNRRDRPS
jgi:Uma2 family endonuclease